MNARRITWLLWLFLAFFTLRVIGQLVVFLFKMPYLPPFEAWQSGLLPYPVLLASQVLIIALMVKMTLNVQRSKGFFAQRRKLFTHWVLYFGLTYLVAMVGRLFYFGFSIPVVFHWILALFLISFAIHHRRTAVTFADVAL